MILTRDEILDAIDYTAKRKHPTMGAAFKGRYEIWAFLDSISIRSEWGWDTGERDRDQRLLFLAFLLTWHDDITGYKE